MPPPEIHVPVAPAEQQLLEDWLAQKRGPQGAHRRAAARQQEGDDGAGASQRRAGLSHALRSRMRPPTTRRSRSLQAALRLPKLPRRIDCFDISTIQGSETVASMVVCEEGRMRPAEYRKFKIKKELARPRAPRPQARRTDDRASSTTLRRWSRSCAGATRRCSRTADRFPI